MGYFLSPLRGCRVKDSAGFFVSVWGGDVLRVDVERDHEAVAAFELEEFLAFGGGVMTNAER
jgi:hypothetical protein